ncbi:MAG: carbohydrate kinase family protein [Chloroflexota bacterium]|nr:carbohydrate kinase family protein [Chloroflexota bacterium]MDE2918682.1 carbohydrate kinase family protein [Chloroflexota bacterium]
MSPATVASSDAPGLLCVGSTVVDVNIQGLTRFPVPDVEFTDVSDVAHEDPARLLLGGTAANTAMVYAGLTGACQLGGVLGADPFGDFLAGGLADHGVEVIGERAGSTATHTIALGVDGRRQAYWYPGPPLDPTPLLAAWTPGHVYLSGINLCFQRPLTVAACAFGSAARSAGARAALDIGQGGPGALDFDEITAIGTEMDLLIGSRAEFAAALGCEYAEGRERLRRRFDGPVVVKLGAGGSLLDPGPGQEPRHVPGFAVQASNPIGAGDAFAGGLLSAWLAGADLDAACRRGNAAGAVSVRSAGGPQDVTKAAVDRLEREG